MVNFNITMSQNLAGEFKRIRNKRRFIAEALREKLQKERKKINLKNLAKEYKQAAEEDRKVNAQWEAATLESWE